MSLFGHGTDRLETLWTNRGELSRGGSPEAPLQRLTPAARVIGAALLLVAAIATRSLLLLVAITTLCIIAALLGRLNLRNYLRAGVVLVALFVAPVALLGALAPFQPGETALALGPVVFTKPGLQSAALLTLRAFCAVSISTLLIRSAGTRGLIDGLRALRMSGSVLAVLQMTISHIHLLGRTAHGMVLGRRARTLQPPSLRQAYEAVAAQGVVLLQKSTEDSRNVHNAMLARGFTGHFPQALITTHRWRIGDTMTVAACMLLTAGAIFP